MTAPHIPSHVAAERVCAFDLGDDAKLRRERRDGFTPALRAGMVTSLRSLPQRWPAATASAAA